MLGLLELNSMYAAAMIIITRLLYALHIIFVHINYSAMNALHYICAF